MVVDAEPRLGIASASTDADKIEDPARKKAARKASAKAVLAVTAAAAAKKQKTNG